MGKFIRRWLGFGPLLLGTINSVVGFLGFDAFMQISGYPGAVKFMQELLQNPPPWFFPSLLVLSFVGFRIANWLERKSVGEEFEEDWNGLDSERSVLKKLLNGAFEKWWREDTPMRPQEFTKRAGFPRDVLDISQEPGGTIYDYAGRTKEQWSGEQKQLLSFCVALYPERGESNLLTPTEQEQLDGARSRLSKFWDKWGRRCFDRQEISIGDFPSRLMKGEISHLILLTYLEIAHARPAEDMGRGKQGLFRMAKVFSDIGN